MRERVSDRDVGFTQGGSLSFPEVSSYSKDATGLQSGNRSEGCVVYIYVLVLYRYLSYVLVVWQSA